ncbi:MAG: hypothetical protein ABWZ75_01175 [Novosphingobium sp.]
MKFDSNRAWKEASAAVTANREVLFAIAGVFILLPSLAFGLLFPQPEAAAGMTGEQAANLLLAFYEESLPWMIPMAILQAVGSMALLTLFTDRTRPTVGEAIRQGAIGLLPYLVAQLLVGFAVSAIAMIVIGLGVATGLAALSFVLVVGVIVFAVYALVKTSLVAPVVVVEGVRNPITALKRSWALTSGNSARIAVFYVLLFFTFMVVIFIASALIGIVAAVIAGAEGARIVNAVVSSTLGATVTVYAVSVVAAVHRQLAGSSPEAVSATFD